MEEHTHIKEVNGKSFGEDLTTKTIKNTPEMKTFIVAYDAAKKWSGEEFCFEFNFELKQI